MKERGIYSVIEMMLPVNNPIIQLTGHYLLSPIAFLFVLVLVAVWLLIKRLPALMRSMRGANWPTAVGKVETVGVRTFVEQSLAEIGYSYFVEGDRHSGYFTRQFAEEQEAWNYATPLKGQSVTVRYKTGAPNISTLRLEDQIPVFQPSAGSFSGSLIRTFVQNLKNS